jgi:NAD(P)-dependent dehydrogenase (short-subunit alcohol dehydrogenase family)
MPGPSLRDVSKLALKAGREVPGTAARLIADDRAILLARRATRRAGLRRAVEGKLVLLVGTELGADLLREAGADVRCVEAGDDPADLAAGAPDVVVFCHAPVAEPAMSTDIEAAERSLEVNYYAMVRAVLAALPAMRERGSGHIVSASAAAPDVAACDRAATAAAEAFLRITSAEVQGDGVTVTSVHLPADPERAARRIGQAVALRTRISPVWLPL